MKNFLITLTSRVLLALAIATPVTQVHATYNLDCGNDGDNDDCCREDDGHNAYSFGQADRNEIDPEHSNDKDCSSGMSLIKPHKANLHREITDITTFGPAPISFTRNLNSRTSDFNSSYWELGYRQVWQHSWNWEMRNEGTIAHPYILLRYPNGNEYDFYPANYPNNSQIVVGTQLIPIARNGDRLYVTGLTSQGAISACTLLNTLGEECDFVRSTAPAFHLAQKRDGLGNSWALSYSSSSSSGALTRITNNFGRWVQVDRETGTDGVVRISQVSTNDGRIVTYHYSQWTSSGNFVLASVTYPGNDQANYTYVTADPSDASARPLLATATDPAYKIGAPAARMNFVYNYNATYGQSLVTGTILQQRSSVADEAVIKFPLGSGTFPQVLKGDDTEITRQYENGQLRIKDDGAGRTTTFTRTSGGYGYIASQADASGTIQYGRDYAGRVLSRTDAMGHVRSHTYNLKGFMLTATDELNQTTTWTRDTVNARPTRKDYPDGSYETWTNYNSNSQPQNHRLRNGGTETFVYDAAGNITSKTDAVGKTWTYTHYSTGLVSSVTDPRLNTTSYTYNWRGQILTMTHPDSTTITYHYDSFGNHDSVTDELGHTTAYSFDEYNRVKTVTDALNRTTTYEYGRAPGCSSCSYAGTLDRVISPSGQVTTYSYDASGLRTCQTVGAGTVDAATTTYEYDDRKNVIRMTDPRGKVWNFGYDNEHRKISAVDPLGNVTLWSYDDHGNKLTEIRPDSGVAHFEYNPRNKLKKVTDSAGQITLMTYDSNDNLVTLTDSRGYAYLFSYDKLDRKTGLTYPAIILDPNDPESGSVSTAEQWTYDPAGNVATYTTRAGQIKTSTYDSRNRETQSTWSGNAAPAVTRTYDAAGRLLTLNTAASNLTFAYDAANELTSETQNVAGLGAKAINYTYWPDRKRKTVTYPDGDILNYAYTSRNQPLLEAINSGPALVTYGYDLNGNRISSALSNSTNTTYTYDDANQPLSIVHQNGGGTFSSFAYGYNSVGNRKYVQRENGKGDVYSYDLNDQVTNAQYEATNPSGTPANPQSTDSFTYDPAGNWSAANGNTYQTNALNQYKGWSSGGCEEGELCLLNPYGYDSNGNLNNNPGWTYYFDAQNRLMSGTMANSGIPAHLQKPPFSSSYDARNRPTSRTSGSTTTYYVYDGWNLIAEFDSNGNQIAKYYHGASADEVLERLGSPSNVYYHSDALGSVARLTNSSGSVVEQYKYSVFGAPTMKNASGSTITTSGYGNRFMFAGREYFSSQGIYDYRNRVYLPGLGRFMQTDPLRFGGKDVNLYRYVGNKVTRSVDPTGFGTCVDGEYHSDGMPYPDDTFHNYAECVAVANAIRNWEVNEDCFECDSCDRIIPVEGCAEQKEAEMEEMIHVCETLFL